MFGDLPVELNRVSAARPRRRQAQLGGIDVAEARWHNTRIAYSTPREKRVAASRSLNDFGKREAATHLIIAHRAIGRSRRRPAEAALGVGCDFLHLFLVDLHAQAGALW